MFIDILPNLIAPVLVLRHAADPDRDRVRGHAVLPRPRRPAADRELGQHARQAQQFYQIAWWYLVFPAACLLITTLAFNLLGDGIRDAMDPRHRTAVRGPSESARAPAGAPQASLAARTGED